MKDLSTPNMDIITGILYSTVSENVCRLKESIEDASEAEIHFKRKEHNENSIAELLKHIAYVDLRWVYRLKCTPIPPELEKEYRPELDEKGNLPSAEGSSLSFLLQQLDAVHQKLKEVCVTLKDENLTKVVSYEKGEKATIRWGLWHMADHNRYHQAHINKLRQMYKRT
ncbi:DinB family protein [Priestia filamentosa]|uniref:DinB family protein n=1 Tax=Priestia filamentosa TaxID=1402861 RepID=UPI003981CD03